MSSGGCFQYGMVARGEIPLAEYSTVQGNHRSIALRMLQSINPQDPRCIVEQAGHTFYSLTDQNRTTFLCLADSSVSRNLQISFCEELQRKWRTRYGNNTNSFMANSKDSEFGPEIATLISIYNNERQKKIAQIKDNISDAQAQMTKNLSLALARGEQLNIMEEKANEIKDSATQFKREATKVKNKMCCQRYMWYFIGIAIGILVIFIILLIACKPNFSACKKKSTPTPEA